MNITEPTTRYYFFTGKGGVGKTSISCATAIALTDTSAKSQADERVKQRR